MNTRPMQSLIIPGMRNSGFSAVCPAALDTNEYTLVTIAVDVSSSINAFVNELKDALKIIIETMRSSPRAENLLLRLISFDTDITEVFGFMTLVDINTDVIDAVTPAGMAALYDAGYESLNATRQYATLLTSQDRIINAALCVISDGWDTASITAHPRLVAECLQSIRHAKTLESIIALLIGINTNQPQVADALDKFASQAMFDQFIATGDATAGNLAKISAYIGETIIKQSLALGSGDVSQRLSFPNEARL